MKNRVVVIGIDGATWDIIAPWCQDGTLPELSRVVNNGVSGILESTTPPVTAPAWVSLATGRNPGKHGIFDFIKIENGKISLNASKDISGDTIYEILSSYGLRSVVIGLPLSYPPKKEFSGIMVSDFLYPKEEVFPPEKSDYLKGYRVSSDPAKKGYDLMEDIIETTESQIALGKRLFVGEPWEFFFILIRETDTVFHNFWQDIKSDSPLKNQAKKVFQIVDEFIGWVVSQIDQNTTLFIVSDHGFSDYRYLLKINMVFQREGLVIPKVTEKQENAVLEERVKAHSKYRRKFVKLPKIIYRAALHPKVSRISKAIYNTLFKGKESKYVSRVDIDRSKAYVPTPLSSAVYINNRSTDSESAKQLRSDVEKILTEIEIENRKVVRKILYKEDIYWGPHLDRAPDMFVVTDGVLLDSGLSGKLYEPFTQGGYHNHRGIVIVYGKNIRRGAEVKDAKIYDILPTILHIIGIPVPEDVDGRVLSEIFSDAKSAGQKPELYLGENRAELNRIKKTISNLKISKKL